MDHDYDFKRMALVLSKEIGIEKTSQILDISANLITRWQETDSQDSSEISRLLYELSESQNRIQLLQKALNQALTKTSSDSSGNSMLTIKTVFSLIRINLNEEFSITTVDCYDGDEYGNPISDSARNVEVYEWGTILIETTHKRYQLHHVCDAYLWTSAIIEYISKYSDRSNISIDLQKLRIDHNNEYIPCNCTSMSIEQI